MRNVETPIGSVQAVGWSQGAAIELLFRDAKQFTGLNDCQARSADKWRFHFNASLSTVSFAKLRARQSSDKPQAPFSMASLKRRYFNQHLVDRVLDQLATEGK